MVSQDSSLPLEIRSCFAADDEAHGVGRTAPLFVFAFSLITLLSREFGDDLVKVVHCTSHHGSCPTSCFSVLGKRRQPREHIFYETERQMTGICYDVIDDRTHFQCAPTLSQTRMRLESDEVCAWQVWKQGQQNVQECDRMSLRATGRGVKSRVTSTPPPRPEPCWAQGRPNLRPHGTRHFP